jgi:hypothetical protein
MSIAHPRRTATLAILFVGTVVAAGAFYHEPSGAAPDAAKHPGVPAQPEQAPQPLTERVRPPQQDRQEDQEQKLEALRRAQATELEFERKREALRAQEEAALREKRERDATDPYSLPFVPPHPELQPAASPSGKVASSTNPSPTNP